MIKNLHVYCTISMMVLIKNKTYMGYFKHFWSFETIEFQILSIEYYYTFQSVFCRRIDRNELTELPDNLFASMTKLQRL